MKNLRRLSPIICSSIILNYLNYLQCPFILLFFNSKANRGLAQSLLSTSELIIIVIVMVRTTFDSGMFSTASLPRLIQHSRLCPRVHEVVPALIYHRHLIIFNTISRITCFLMVSVQYLTEGLQSTEASPHNEQVKCLKTTNWK